MDWWDDLLYGSRVVRTENSILRYDGERVTITYGPFCCVCDLAGSGMTELPDGRHVHRWPCRERVR